MTKRSHSAATRFSSRRLLPICAAAFFVLLFAAAPNLAPVSATPPDAIKAPPAQSQAFTKEKTTPAAAAEKSAAEKTSTEKTSLAPPLATTRLSGLSSTPRLEQILLGGTPQNKEELKAMQERLRQLAAKVIPVTVGIRLPSGMGSGVIISEDGYVLTAGHVSNRPGRDIKVILPDGRQVSARTLGANYGIDSGLVKITEPGKWPHAELGDSSRLKLGQWCLVTGHPGGFDKGRTAPLRVGRILELSPGTIVTDCTLVGGDSGGPLFDADGHVIGINSRIGNELYANL
ncbi:MAG: serine protease, partial [Planctomycetia bacterium]|nr:serine protease [Planctomycetia bacterium]